MAMSSLLYRPRTIFYLICVFSKLNTVIGSSEGADPSTCKSLVADHDDYEPKIAPDSLVLKIEPIEDDLQELKVSLRCINLTVCIFKGFILQVRMLDGPPFGTIRSSNPYILIKTMDCSSRQDTLTHSKADNFTEVEAIWRSDSAYSGEIVAMAGVVVNFETFYLPIASESLFINSVAVDTGAEPQLSIIQIEPAVQPAIYELGDYSISADDSIKTLDYVQLRLENRSLLTMDSAVKVDASGAVVDHDDNVYEMIPLMGGYAKPDNASLTNDSMVIMNMVGGYVDGNSLPNSSVQVYPMVETGQYSSGWMGTGGDDPLGLHDLMGQSSNGTIDSLTIFSSILENMFANHPVPEADGRNVSSPVEHPPANVTSHAEGFLSMVKSIIMPSLIMEDEGIDFTNRTGAVESMMASHNGSMILKMLGIKEPPPDVQVTIDAVSFEVVGNASTSFLRDFNNLTEKIMSMFPPAMPIVDGPVDEKKLEETITKAMLVMLNPMPGPPTDMEATGGLGPSDMVVEDNEDNRQLMDMWSNFPKIVKQYSDLIANFQKAFLKPRDSEKRDMKNGQASVIDAFWKIKMAAMMIMNAIAILA